MGSTAAGRRPRLALRLRRADRLAQAPADKGRPGPAGRGAKGRDPADPGSPVRPPRALADMVAHADRPDLRGRGAPSLVREPPQAPDRALGPDPRALPPAPELDLHQPRAGGASVE